MLSGLTFDPAAAAYGGCTCAGTGYVPEGMKSIVGHVAPNSRLCACTGAHGRAAKRAQRIMCGVLRPLWNRG